MGGKLNFLPSGQEARRSSQETVSLHPLSPHLSKGIILLPVFTDLSGLLKLLAVLGYLLLCFCYAFSYLTAYVCVWWWDVCGERGVGMTSKSHSEGDILHERVESGGFSLAME